LVKHDPQLTGLATQKQGAAAARSVNESFPEIQLPQWIVLFPGKTKPRIFGQNFTSLAETVGKLLDFVVE
jgi:hypothetical protein